MKRIKFSLSLTTVFSIMIIFSCLYCAKVAYATTFSNTYDKTTPAGTDSPTIIDDRIRETKLAIQERMNVSHYWPYASEADVAGGNEVASRYTGEHRMVDFYGSISDPTQVSGKAHLYMKSDELYYQDDTNTTLKLTSGGALNSSAGLAVTGNATIGGTLGVTGASTFTAGITANGGVTLGAGDDLIGSSTSDITINTNKFTVAGATGNTVVAGTLGVTGASTFAGGIFGSWATKVKNTVYEAASDGIVVAYGSGGSGTTDHMIGYTDGSNPPTTIRIVSGEGAEQYLGFTMPVRKGDYWKVSTTGANCTFVVRWLPIGG